MKILVLSDFHGKFPEKLERIAKSKEIDLIIALGDYAGIEEWRPYLSYCFHYWAKGKKPRKSLEEFLGEAGSKKLLKKDDIAGRHVLKELNNFGKETLFVFGNADTEFYNYPFDDFIYATKANLKFIKKLTNLKGITYSKKKIKYINFVGFGGYMDASANYEKRPKTKDAKERLKCMQERNTRAEKKFNNIITGVKGEKIFVFHYPPEGVFDKIKDRKNPYHGKSSGVKFFAKAIKKYKPKLVLCGHMHEYQGKKMLGKSLVVNPGAVYEGKAAVIEWPSLKVEFLR